MGVGCVGVTWGVMGWGGPVQGGMVVRNGARLGGVSRDHPSL